MTTNNITNEILQKLIAGAANSRRGRAGDRKSGDPKKRAGSRAGGAPPKGNNRSDEKESKALAIARRVTNGTSTKFMTDLFCALADKTVYQGDDSVRNWVTSGCPVAANFASRPLIPCEVDYPADLGGCFRTVTVANTGKFPIYGHGADLEAVPPPGSLSYHATDAGTTTFLVWGAQPNPLPKWTAQELETMMFVWKRLPPYTYVVGGKWVAPAVMPIHRQTTAVDGWGFPLLYIMKKIMKLNLDQERSTVPQKLLANGLLAPGAIAVMASRVGPYDQGAAAAASMPIGMAQLFT